MNEFFKDPTEPFKAHPNLGDEINEAIASSELEGGIFVDKLPVGKGLEVSTSSGTIYTIRKISEKEYTITGSQKYCPDPVKARIHGSTWGTPMIKLDFIGRGMQLKFSTENHPSPIITSSVKEIKEIN